MKSVPYLSWLGADVPAVYLYDDPVAGAGAGVGAAALRGGAGQRVAPVDGDPHLAAAAAAPLRARVSPLGDGAVARAHADTVQHRVLVLVLHLSEEEFFGIDLQYNLHHSSF